MNYLAHFYWNFRRDQNHPPEFYLGSVLPDLLGAWDRSKRFNKTKIHDLLTRSESPALWHGVLDHLEADARFHQSPFFKDSFESVRKSLIRGLPAGINVRIFFLAHIAVEILLDHHLTSLFPDLPSRFYEKLDAIDRHRVHHELEIYFQTTMAPFHNHFRRFMEVRFLDDYARFDQLYEPVNRMLIRTRQEPFLGDGQELLLNLLRDGLDIVRQNYPVLFPNR